MALLAAYNFDNGSGTQLLDVSGNAHHLPLPTSSGMPTWATGGHTGGGISVGEGDQTQTWGITQSNWSTWLPTAAITTMGWVKINTANTYALLISLGGTTGLTGNFDLWYMNGDAVQIMMRTAAAPSTNVQVASSFSPDSTWHHWAATYNGTTLILYKDGVSQGSTTAASGPLGYPDSGNLTLLAPTSSVFQTFMCTGFLDDVRIYNTALTPTQITAQMNTPVQRSVSGWGVSI